MSVSSYVAGGEFSREISITIAVGAPRSELGISSSSSENKVVLSGIPFEEYHMFVSYSGEHGGA